MRFASIRYDGDTVSLKWETPDNDGVDKHEWSCDEPPTPAFRSALAAFGPYVVELIDAPDDWKADIDVRQLVLKEEEKTSARGIVVTALRKCSKAKNRTLLLNTPYLSEPPADYNGPMVGYLSSAVVALIEAAEEQAEKYRGGERGEQTTLELSDNTKAFNERAAAAEGATTRRPRGRKKNPDFVPGVGDVVNPDATEPITDASLRQLLLSVERDVPIDAIATWTSIERDLAASWAMATQRCITGQIKAGDVPKEPKCVKKSATLALTADQWTTDPPPAARDVSSVLPNG